MKPISRHQFEVKLSDQQAREFFSYGKRRVSGSQSNTYIMHCRSACMPGKETLFVSNSKTKPKDISEKNMLQMKNIFVREKFTNQREPIGKKFLHNSKELYTYQRFHPYNDESLEVAIIAAYKQVYGNLYAMESERPKEFERRLRNGDIPIREFIRELAKSSFYLENFFHKVNQKRCIELNFMHLLGRPIINNKELEKNILLINDQGFNGHIDFLIDSLEYEEFFGADIVPYQRFWNSPCGGRTSSFIKTASLKASSASSDNVIYI